MSQPDYVRVKSKDTGHELTVPVSHYDAYEDAYQVLDKPATDSAGDALPPKYKTTVAEATTKKRATPKKRATAKKTTAAPAAAEQAPEGAGTSKENS